MKCSRCQHENPTGMKFCGQCAAPLASTCGSCGAANPPENKFCGQCAAQLLSAPATKSAAPDSYTPKHLAEKILTSRAALEGERKQVTVLFADLKGSMELLADRDPEEARKVLDPVLERMMEAVHRYEGTVNQVMGDGIMALFGAPLAHEDHAVRACYAALRMQETVAGYAEGVLREHGVRIRIRVGLNSGEVVVRAIGSDLHMDYTAVGQITHLAARMEQLADPGSTLLTAATLALAEGFVQVKPLGPMAVKGLPAPVEVYELAGVSAVRSRLQAAAARGLSRFVGRDAELEQLSRALEQAGQGRGQVTAIVGEPGVGKSRLVFELTQSHRVEGWLVLETGSLSYGKATSYLPVIDLLKGYFHIGDRDTPREIREKVTGRVLTLDQALEPTLPALLALLEVSGDDPAWQALDPPQRRQRTLDAVKRLLLREAQVQPLLVVFEDLHWIDSETQAFLDGLIESLPTSRMLVLVSYRPEYHHDWGSKTYYTQVRLDALGAEGVERLFDAVLGADPTLQLLKPVLLARTGGNPFFLEECVRALVETQALTGENGAYRLIQPIDVVKVPASVQAVLAARIDRLPPEEKRLLQAAAVVGKDVPFSLLQAIADLTEDDLRRGLVSLQAAEFLYETSLFPDLEHTFKHALTHEVAYGSVLHERRRALHAQIVRAIETLHSDRLAEHVERLAYHAVRAELWEKALRYLRPAGAKAAARLAYREATAYFEQAVTATQRVPRRLEVLEESIDLRVELRTTLFPLDAYDRLRDHLNEGAALAREIGDDFRLARITAFQAHYLSIMVGQSLPALDLARDAMSIAGTVGAGTLVGLARTVLGMVQHGHGDFLEAISTLTVNVEFLQDDLLHERGGFALPASLISQVWLAFAFAEVGRFAQGIATGEQAIQQAEALGQAYGLFHAYWALCAVYLERGDHERAVELGSRAYGIGYETHWQQALDNAAGLLGHAHSLGGRFAEALTLLEGKLTATERGPAFVWHRDLYYLGGAYLRSRRQEDALRVARSALEIARTSHQRGREARAVHLLGAAHAARNDTSEAEDHYRDALRLASDLSMRPLVAHCHLGLGKLYRRTDEHEQAREHLTIATTMYREMGMTYWLEKAESETRESE
jgi:class 3 adenylate cyclase/tetratricopeptide (TPR) repeat protein